MTLRDPKHRPHKFSPIPFHGLPAPVRLSGNGATRPNRPDSNVGAVCFRQSRQKGVQTRRFFVL
jgi:hypothetical protein